MTNFLRFKSDRLASFRLIGLLMLLSNLPLIGTAQCTLVCKSSLNLSLPLNGEVLVQPSLLLADPGCNSADFYVEITDNAGNMIGDLVTCNVVGQSVIAKVIHITNGNNCTTILNVFDYIAPQFACLDTTISCINPYTPQDIGNPVITENCSIANLDFNDQFIDLPCLSVNGNDTITSKVERTWTAVDESGNPATCLQTIYLKRITVDDVVFPANRDGIVAPVLDCMDDPNDLSLTGEPEVNGLPLSSGGNCELVASSSDQQVDICGVGGYRILRTWTVINYCTGNFKIHIQVIKVIDTTAPVIVCPADIVVNTNSYNCTSTVNLPLASASDDCSNIMITPSWSYGNGYGPFNNIPIGNHIVMYTAEDDCGNTSTCTMTVSVEDQTIPAMVCNGDIIVQLNTTGAGYLNAFSVDDGSEDNCGLDYFEVSRDNINFGSTVSVDCEDVNQIVMVTLRAFDLAGNSNFCTVSVTVNDGVSPAIACPSNVYVECADDITNVNNVGQAIALDACGIDTLYYSDIIDLNSCQVGTIDRTWTTIDINNNSKSCLQTIFVEDNTPITVTFPADYTSSFCIVPLDTTITGQPVVSNKDCESISINYTDQQFDIADPACYTIIRNWVVIDWCQYDPNSGSMDGYFTDVQVITISDNDAPVMNCPNDITVGSLHPTCGATYVSLTPVTAVDCNPNLNFTNDSPYAISNGADASGNYPIGAHIVNFVASDGCGNQSSCSMVITVEDALPPNASCLSTVTINIGTDGVGVITATQIDNGSSDNCTATSNLQFMLNRDTFTCLDLGIQNVQLMVTDEMNLSTSCNVMVDVQNILGVCAPSTASISGHIVNEKGRAVSQTTVYLLGDHLDSTMTDNDGYYNFGSVPQGGDYTISPYKNVNFLNGVSTLDLIMISQHILGINELTTPYTRLAADANHSLTITSYDMIGIRKMLLLIDTIYPSNSSWRFIDANYTFIDPEFPFTEDYPQEINISNLTTDVDNVDFIGVKIGDMNINNSTNQLTSGDTRNEELGVVLETEDIWMEAGMTYTIPLQATDWELISGFQFGMSLNHEKAELLDIGFNEFSEKIEIGKDNFGITKLKDGTLTASWINRGNHNIEGTKNLFHIKIKCTKASRLSEILSLNTTNLETASYLKDDTGVFVAATFDIEFYLPTEESETKIALEKLQIFQNYPNPIKDYTKLRVDVGEEVCLEFSLFDNFGRNLWQQSKCLERGEQEMILNRTDFGNSVGIYYLEVSDGNGWHKTLKMMVVD